MNIEENVPVIAVVGCGFIGSHLADELPKLCFSQDILPFKFRFIDYDTWEERNAANQHVSQVIAKKEELKAITCARYAEAYSFNKSEAITEKLTGENAKRLIGDTILVIDAVDNIPTRQLMWGMAKAGVSGPCMHTGISRKGEGIINWSSPKFDTFPFKPNDVAGRDLKNQDFKEPPCEMYKYRSAGMSLVQTIAKATSFFFGKDPWGMFTETTPERGTMTCWSTDSDGSHIFTDAMFMTEEGFFPECFPMPLQKD